MDVMELRRRILAVMANGGAEVIKGQFTVPDSGYNYTIDFGKTFTKYLYLIEMTDASKQTLVQSGYNANKTFARAGCYPIPTVNSVAWSNTPDTTYRINPSTLALVATSATTNGTTGSQITLPIGDLSASATTSVYKGLTYSYIIVSLDGI